MSTVIENHSVTTRTQRQPGITTPGIPDYAHELRAFHRAFAGELRGIIAELPVSPTMQVIDVGCGDGYYTGLFAERLRAPGSITGFDSNADYLKLARERLTSHAFECHVAIVQGELEKISALAGQFDMVWCAQSLFSLPEPVVALQQMATALRPGGLLFVLENDTAHQLLLPWPGRLELAVKQAELAALGDATARPEKYFVGRHLPELFVAAGLEPLGIRSQSIDRRSPFDHDLTEFLVAFMRRLSERVTPYLDTESSQELQNLFDVKSDSCLLHQPFVSITWLNKLAWARKPVGASVGHESHSDGPYSACPEETDRGERPDETMSHDTLPPPEGSSRQQEFRGGLHLKSKKSTSRGVRRLIRRQIDNLDYLLEQSRSGRDCVHDIRKTLKKTRALLRLVRSDLGRDIYRRENTRLRDAARLYRDVRDAQALVACFDRVGKIACGGADDALWNQIHGRVVTDAQRSALALASRNTIETTSAMVSKFSSRLRKWKPAFHRWTGLLRGLRKTYRAARRAFQRAGAEASIENLHEWRKQAKYLGHELEVIERVGPHAIRRLGKHLHELTGVLGEDHDLAALRKTLDGHLMNGPGPQPCTAETAVESLAQSIDGQREKLQRRAFKLGERLFQEPPRTWTAGLRR